MRRGSYQEGVGDLHRGEVDTECRNGCVKRLHYQLKAAPARLRLSPSISLLALLVGQINEWQSEA